MWGGSLSPPGKGRGMAVGGAVRSVAVVGAGAAGLASVRALRREGLAVTAFEARAGVGGTWVLEPGARGAQSSLYESLRTNLPRELMGFQELPFTGPPGTSTYCGHREVRQYLEAYAQSFDLTKDIRFNSRVVSARPVSVEGGRGRGWRVEVEEGPVGGSAEVSKDVVCRYHMDYDALCVCNGHYTEARFPAEAEACEPFADREGCWQMHSHEYREPARFRDKRVVLVGGGPSAMDLSVEIASVAEKVFISSRDMDPSLLAKINAECSVTIEARPWINTAKPGVAHFEDGSTSEADVIVWCTGYSYSFPWLEMEASKEGGSLGGDSIPELYRHVFLPEYAPDLSFVGIPFKVAPFPQFELQAAWVARCLSGRAALPSETEMRRRASEELELQRERFALPRHTHQLGGLQWDYNDALAAESGFSPLAGWRRRMYDASKDNRARNPGVYRNRLPGDLESSLSEAYEYFKYM